MSVYAGAVIDIVVSMVNVVERAVALRCPILVCGDGDGDVLAGFHVESDGMVGQTQTQTRH